MTAENFMSISLPSKGLLYDGVDINAIKIRTFKGKEDALIAELNSSNLGKKFCAVLENVMTGIDPKRLTSGDAKYIMLWEAINSYGNEYKQQLTCENCLEKINVTFDLNCIDSKELADNFVQPVEVQLSDCTVQVCLTTLGDEIRSFSLSKTMSSPSLHLYATSIVNSEMLPNDVEKIKFLENLSTADLNKIKEIHAKNEHGPDMIVSYTCPECGYEGKLELPFRLTELFSFRK